ncbi:MAG: hypothetical protein OCD76_18050 [Reichenbachiella sp.]
MKKIKIVALLLVLQGSASYAQDAHYWTEQYGNKSTMMSGSVVGTVQDLGAIFYNPARLALQNDPTFLLSAKAYQHVSLKVKDGIGQADLGTTKFGSAPTLAAVSFNLDSVKFLKFLHGHKFAYGFLSRNQFDYSLGATVEREYPFNPSWPGDDFLETQVSWNKSVKDEWMGFTWAIPLNDKWSIGSSHFISTYSQSNTYNQTMIAYASADTTVESTQAQYVINRNRSISSLGYIGKFAMNYNGKILDIGVTYTTPRIRINGNASTYYERHLAGYEHGGLPDSEGNIFYPIKEIYESGKDGDAYGTYRSPMSLALGVGLQLGRLAKLSLSAEWFDKVAQHYAVIPEPFNRTRIKSNDPDFVEEPLTINNRYIDKRKSIINFGVGIEWKMLEKLDMFTSFATDYSSLEKTNRNDGTALTNTDNFDNNLFTANIFHYGQGFTLELKRMEFTIGAVYSRGIQPIATIVNFPNTAEEVLEGDDAIQYTDLIWQRWKVLIGFSLPFYKFGS